MPTFINVLDMYHRVANSQYLIPLKADWYPRRLHGLGEENIVADMPRRNAVVYIDSPEALIVVV